ncbi:hypothetical protein RUM43_012595 [Polyplax serrata]|uniref:Methionine--tRNA ligase, mitochondrial n=1 Tax=Polyplax serrata TaxID=468196 RepID=A0AAN8NY71_POLSC
MQQPILYNNTYILQPHVGHLYTACIADAMARYQKLKNPDIKIKFMVGTDEHGLKVSQSAQKAGLDVQKFCDAISSKYKSLFDLFSIEASDFLRTTEQRHCQTAVTLWNRIASEDLIYKETYSGWYCLADEMFVSEVYLNPQSDDTDVRYTKTGKPVQYVSEVNYKFKLSKFQKDLLHWLDNGAIVKPSMFQKELRQMILEGDVLKDISISRPTERVSWGIPVPGDASQTMYVWFDALSSYLTCNGYPDSNFKWPPDVQIIGKDILKFHGVFWPAFLIAAGLKPPKSILCHSHWLRDDEKISKSKGNIIDPFHEVKKYTSDGFRYFLLREGVPHSDGNYTNVKIHDILNAELANTLGNLMSRCIGRAINKENIFPGCTQNDLKSFGDASSENLINSLQELPGLVQCSFEEFNFYQGIDAIFATLRQTNKFIDEKKPWKIAKTPGGEEELQFVLHLALESLRVCGIVLQPIIPNIAGRILDILCVHVNNRSLKDIRPFSWESTDRSADIKLNTIESVLFRRIEAAG